jgi:hypothetical protein
VTEPDIFYRSAILRIAALQPVGMRCGCRNDSASAVFSSPLRAPQIGGIAPVLGRTQRQRRRPSWRRSARSPTRYGQPPWVLCSGPVADQRDTATAYA